jgi:hypothetical protein
MPATSYFKVSPPPSPLNAINPPFQPLDGVFLFDGRDIRSASNAFENARSFARDHRRARVSVWKPPMSSGPWSSLPRIGEFGEASSSIAESAGAMQ